MELFDIKNSWADLPLAVGKSASCLFAACPLQAGGKEIVCEGKVPEGGKIK